MDFFTPILDEPADFGRVAAANALSDVYAMGAKPLTALNIVAYPMGTMGPEILADILRGSQEKLEEAGVTLLGGHSIDDLEPKFGLAVTGLVHPDRVRTNAGGKAGDVLVLTKPIGAGAVTTAIKQNQASEEDIAEVTRVMTALNRVAGEAVQDNPHVHAVTDVTGFGLAGHAHEMALGSGLVAEIDVSSVPVIPAARQFIAKKIFPGGTKRNFQAAVKFASFEPSIDETERFLMCDAVTSGGLLVALAEDGVDEYMKRLQDGGVRASIIGRLVAPDSEREVGRIRFIRSKDGVGM